MLSHLPKTCLIVPCYNEAQRLPCGEFERFARSWPALRLCFVNDGSSDPTDTVLHALAARIGSQAAVLSLAHNSGKAEAVRQGIHYALAGDPVDFIGYWDADLATPLGELVRLQATFVEHPAAELVTGCRLRRMGARIERRAVRHLLGRVFATVASYVLNLHVYDTQCGAKLFRTDLAREVFAAPFTTSWCFDVEALGRVAALRGPARSAHCIVETPLLQWTEIGGSKLRLRHWVKALLDLARIYLLQRRAMREPPKTLAGTVRSPASAASADRAADVQKAA